MGSLKQRLGVESQLPFGYCSLSMYPIEDAVATPSGHLYSRESIFEYLLSKSKELKRQQELFEEQQRRLEEEQREHLRKLKNQEAEQFLQATDGIASVAKRTREDALESSEYFKSRKKIIDDTEKDVRIEELKRVAPWVPQFTPEAKETMIKQPPKRPPSPFSGRPLRAKDLIPVDLMREPEGDDSKTRFLCPVSRYVVTFVFPFKNSTHIFMHLEKLSQTKRLFLSRQLEHICSKRWRKNWLFLR